VTTERLWGVPRDTIRRTAFAINKMPIATAAGMDVDSRRMAGANHIAAEEA